MSDWIKEKWDGGALHRMFLLKMFLSSIAIFAIAWQTSVANIELANLDKWQWINLWIGIVGLWTNNIISLLDKTASRINEGKSPFSEGNTEILTKQKENG